MYKKTALYDYHSKLGAKFVEFAGYSMPIWYTRHQSEHLAVRKLCGMFDISHMGLFLFKGSNIKDILQNFSCNVLSNKNVYTMILNRDGKILDDVMISPFNDNDFLMVVNASNKEKLINYFTENKCKLTNLSNTHSFLAIQGPKSLAKLSNILNFDLCNLKPMSLIKTKYLNSHIWISQTGYTGEKGVEVIIKNEFVNKFWKQCLELDIQPCGLAARDSLRLEKGFCLYGHELSENITPLETHYSWVVKYNHDFIGKNALIHQKSNGIPTKIIPFTCEQIVIPRKGYKIYDHSVCVGEVCSGTLSPILNQAIGLARVSNKKHEKLYLEIRGSKTEIKTVKLPFV